VALPVVVLDCLGDSIEIPLLGFGVVSPSLEPDVVGTVALNHSVEWELRDNVEWSVDMETEVFIESFSLRSLSFIEINDIPLLVSCLTVTENSNCLTFFILASFNFNDLVVVPVNELVILILENLEPSRVGAPNLHVVGLTRRFDVPRLVVQSGSDSQGLLVEVPDLGSSSVRDLDDHVSVIDQVKISVVWKS
jgi:hypothetical protein